MKAPSRPKFSRNPAARAAFLAKRQEIERRLQQGEFMRDIFEELRLAGSYTQFTRYVAKYLPDARPRIAAEDEGPRTRPPLEGAAPAAPAAPISSDGSSVPAAAGEGPLQAKRPSSERPKYDPTKIRRSELY